MSLSVVSNTYIKMLKAIFIFLICFYVDCSKIDYCNKNLKDVNILYQSVHSINWSETKNGLNTVTNPRKILIVNQSVPILCENTIKDFDVLFELTLTNDRIAKIKPGAFVNLRQLFLLNLADNDLVEIRHGVFSFLQIGVLKLQNNEIKTIESTAFDDMTKLKILDLGNNKLKLLDANWFKNTPNIIILRLEYNEIFSLGANAFPNLKRSYDFEPLVTLDLSNNKITSIHKNAFDDINELGSLYLDDNGIKSLDDNTFSTISNFTLLSLNGNSIKCLPLKLNNILKADRVFMADNPWDCECLEHVNARVNKNKVDLSYPVMKCLLNELSDGRMDEWTIH